jgi:L-threonylcarbamoyladenylate synthase
MTQIIKINAKEINQAVIAGAAEILKNNGLVAFPTETVYGLGANAFDDEAVMKIFRAKNRPADNPLIVHVSNMKMLSEVVESLSPLAKKLIKKYWPGPLTLVMKKSRKIPDSVSCGLESVAVRMPANNIALKLIEAAGVPIAAPSANLSTRPSPTKGEHVLDDLDGKIDLILDGGSCDIGLESSVLDISQKKPLLLRPGKITLEELKDFLGEVESNTSSNKPSSPGMKYRHYSPKAKIFLVNNSEIKEQFKMLKKQDKKVALFTFENKDINADFVFCFNGDYSLMAREIFSLFREADKRKIDFILIEGIKEEGLGLAIMNRLRKAASRKS